MRLPLLFTAICLTGLLNFAQAQTTILDFEDAATSTDFQHFGSTIDGTIQSAVANPDASGINTSDSVMLHSRPANSETWAGAWSNPVPATAIDVTNGEMICMKVWMPAAGNVMLKLEESSTGGGNWEVAQDVTTSGEWVEVCWDPATPSDADGAIASGNIYAKVVMFFDFGIVGTADLDYYFDDLMVMTTTPPTAGCVPILDFEPGGLTAKFQHFGSTIDGTVVSAVANPDMTGLNTSDSVMAHVKPANSETWAGAYSNPNPTTAVDVTNGDSIRMKVWMPAAGNVMLKLEESSTGGSNWEVAKDVTTAGEWVEVVWDPATPSDADGAIASGNSYAKIVMFFDFGTVLTAEATYYFDDICVGTESSTDGIRDQLVQNFFSVAPNPTSDFVNISMEANPAEAAAVVVTDLQGRVVYNTTLDAGNTTHQVPVSNWTAGMYLVRVSAGNTFGIKKLIVR